MRPQKNHGLQNSPRALYKTDPSKIKLAFNNARSLHKHFKYTSNQMCCLQMLLVLLNVGCVQGMKMTLIDSDVSD